MNDHDPTRRASATTWNEADTCRKFVVPKLQAAGWDEEPRSIAEQRALTDGRIVVRGNRSGALGEMVNVFVDLTNCARRRTHGRNGSMPINAHATGLTARRVTACAEGPGDGLSKRMICVYKQSADNASNDEEWIMRARLIVDYISGLMETHALIWYQNSMGISLGIYDR